MQNVMSCDKWELWKASKSLSFRLVSPFPTVKAYNNSLGSLDDGVIPEEESLVSRQKRRMREKLKHETGYDRVRRMYRRNEFGSISPELNNIFKAGLNSFVVGGIIGGIVAMGQARADFFRRNTSTQFESEYLAKRQLTDRMTLTALKGGYKSGIKFGAFSTLYLLISFTAANYNNKVTVFEHVAAGAICGGILKVNHGLKGIAAAGSLGGFLGMICGSILFISMRISGITFEEYRYWQHDEYFENLASGKERKF